MPKKIKRVKIPASWRNENMDTNPTFSYMGVRNPATGEIYEAYKDFYVNYWNTPRYYSFSSPEVEAFFTSTPESSINLESFDVPLIDSFDFEAELRYFTYSGNHIWLEDTKTGIRYVMFLRDFHTVIPRLLDGKVEGWWTFTKRGSRFGLKYIED